VLREFLAGRRRPAIHKNLHRPLAGRSGKALIAPIIRRTIWQNRLRHRSLRRDQLCRLKEATMNEADALPPYMLDIRELTAEAFAPYGQVIAPLRAGGQGAETGYDPEASANEAKLVLANGEPRLWIMHLPHVGLGFTRIARHRRVTQCLGSLGGKEWLIGVAPPAISAMAHVRALRTLWPSGCRAIA